MILIPCGYATQFINTEIIGLKMIKGFMIGFIMLIH